MIDASKVRELLHYDRETGVFLWKVSPKYNIPAGSVAGGNTSNGKYRFIKINSKSYLLHRVAFLYEYGRWPAGEIDHINGDGMDNRIVNLREVDTKDNLLNRKRYTTNTSGVKGVSFHGQSSMWRARIQKFGKRTSLGLYKTKEEAMAAYDKAASEVFGEFSRRGVNGHMERSDIHEKMRALSVKRAKPVQS